MGGLISADRPPNELYKSRMPPLRNLPEDPSTPFNQQSAGLWNRRLILHLLNQEERLSRRQIAQRTGILSSTVAYIVRDLLDQGLLIIEGKEPAAGVGRRNILLSVNAEYGWGAGVALLHNETARIELLNTGLQRLASTEVPFDPDPEVLPGQLTERFEAWLQQRGRPAGKFMGLCVGLPGIVDTSNNVVLTSRRFRYRDFPLGPKLEALVGATVQVERNADLGALAERRFGCASPLTNFIYLLMNRSENREGRPYSYGAALYLDGKPYRGSRFAAGELDRIEIPHLHVDTAEGHRLKALLADENGILTPNLTEIAKFLGDYLTPVVDLLDPEAIVLGGDWPLVNRSFLSLLEGWIQRLVIPVKGRHVAVLPSRLGSSGVACGAALRIVETGLYERELAERGRNGARGAEVRSAPLPAEAETHV